MSPRPEVSLLVRVLWTVALVLFGSELAWADMLSQSDPTAAAARQERPYVIVIDPGHGGEDFGTQGCGIALEKQVVLGIAKRMAERLRAVPGIEVLLTRDDDVFVPLRERTEIARRARGDIFVSIHANSSPSAGAKGAEVYFLSLKGASDQAAAELADRENAALLVGGGRESELDDELLSILMDLQGTGIQTLSAALAEATLLAFEDQATASARAVKQAGFAVLRSLSMPSILVEVGFLSHRSEAERLRSEPGQQRIANAMADALLEHLREHGRQYLAGSAGEAASRSSQGDDSDTHPN